MAVATNVDGEIKRVARAPGPSGAHASTSDAAGDAPRSNKHRSPRDGRHSLVLPLDHRADSTRLDTEELAEAQGHKKTDSTSDGGAHWQ